MNHDSWILRKFSSLLNKKNIMIFRKKGRIYSCVCLDFGELTLLSTPYYEFNLWKKYINYKWGFPERARRRITVERERCRVLCNCERLLTHRFRRLPRIFSPASPSSAVLFLVGNNLRHRSFLWAYNHIPILLLHQQHLNLPIRITPPPLDLPQFLPSLTGILRTATSLFSTSLPAW